MEAVIEKECSALGGLFQTIISDMKGSYPVWEDFINKAGKLQSQLRTTVVAAAAFLDAFQKVADMATNTRAGYTFLCALEDNHTHANISLLSVTAIGRKREERRWIHR
ncbi:metastasis suppressor protein 1-like isoform X3 [Myotis lucifugus]|uniref:metastasis suppressor protein 1-like isoform X3 n=1 Tax=Myotis lucifugus TaxID=59463 RepID=UPI000CCC4BC4|nr:metastasis suppressor protein 1-like isoform X3 [Myotis lucifugus]